MRSRSELIKSIIWKVGGKRPVGYKRRGKAMEAVQPARVPLRYDAINLDTNNTCNQRCRFCFNDFSARPCYMTEEIFSRALEILPMLKESGDEGTGFYFSCLWEPLVSARFLKLLSMIPEEGRKKAFFTTNLSRPLDNGMMKAILSANLHHINISIESLREDRFADLSGSGNYDNFRKNLRLLAEVYKKLPPERRPRLYYITMVLKENRDELLEIIHMTQEEAFAYRNELRTPFIDNYQNMGWNYGQFLPETECAELRSKLRKENIRLILKNIFRSPVSGKGERLHKPIVYSIQSEEELPPMPEAKAEGMDQEETEKSILDAGQTDDQKAEAVSSALMEESASNMPDSERYRIRHELDVVTIPEYMFVRCSSGGELHFLGLDEKVDISSLEDVKEGFSSRLIRLAERRNRAFIYEKSVNTSGAEPFDYEMIVDKAEEDEKTLSLKGRIIARAELLSERFDMVFAADTGKAFYIKTEVSPALAYLCREGEAAAYFSCHMDTGILGSGDIEGHILLMDPESGKAVYRGAEVLRIKR